MSRFKFNRRQIFVLPALAISALPGCQDHNQLALTLGAPRPNAAQVRAAQTLRLPVSDEPFVLRDATQVLLDLGFTIDESSADLGVLVGSKSRDATEAGQVAAAIALSVAAAFFLVAIVPTWDTDQTIRVNLTTRSVLEAGGVEVRVTFERRITTNQGQSRFELLEDAEMHREFFNLLQQSVARGNR